MQRRAFSSAAGLLNSSHVSSRVLNVVKTIRCVPDNMAATTKFNDVGFDSLYRKDLAAKLQAEFRVDLTEKDVANFHNCEDVTKFFSSHPKAR